MSGTAEVGATCAFKHDLYELVFTGMYATQHAIFGFNEAFSCFTKGVVRRTYWLPKNVTLALLLKEFNACYGGR